MHLIQAIFPYYSASPFYFPLTSYSIATACPPPAPACDCKCEDNAALPGI